MRKLTDIVESLEGKIILVRTDLNVPTHEDGSVADETRLIATLPTIKYLLSHGGKIIIITHFGRPKPFYNNEGEQIGPINSTYNIPPSITDIYMKHGVIIKNKLDTAIGKEVTNSIAAMNNGEAIILGNVRFYEGETENNPSFAKNLSHSADIFVMDAFGASHRNHASTYGLRDHVTNSVMGLLMEKELHYMNMIIHSKTRPMAAIIGGSKISSKLGVVKSLIHKCDKIIIGGGMANTFLKAKGYDIGESLVENDMLDTVKEIEEEASQNNTELVLPIDMVIAKTYTNDSETRVIKKGESCNNWMILDIGPDTVSHFIERLHDCRVIVWNGPMGVFELETFSTGTKDIATNLSQQTNDGKLVVVGGGDSVSAINKFNLAEHMTHVSTGGGAMLEYLEGRFTI